MANMPGQFKCLSAPRKYTRGWVERREVSLKDDQHSIIECRASSLTTVCTSWYLHSTMYHRGSIQFPVTWPGKFRSITFVFARYAAISRGIKYSNDGVVSTCGFTRANQRNECSLKKVRYVHRCTEKKNWDGRPSHIRWRNVPHWSDFPMRDGKVSMRGAGMLPDLVAFWRYESWKNWDLW